jgi:hypothetical protein
MTGTHDPNGSDQGRARDAGDERGPRRARGPFGPLEMLDDVQRQAFEAAMRVAGELTALSGDLAGSTWFTDPFTRAAGNGSNGSDGNGSAAGDGDAGTRSAPRVDVGKLRGDVVRAAETFSELMRAMLDVGFDAMDELARRPTPRPSAAAPAGGLAQLHCTVHNDHRDSVRGARPRVGEMVSDNGVALEAAITIRPDTLDLEPHERATLEIDVAIPSHARPGRYHGLLLVAGLTEVASAITVEVADGTAVS